MGKKKNDHGLARFAANPGYAGLSISNQQRSSSSDDASAKDKQDAKDLDELKKQLQLLNTNVDKLSGSIGQAAEGNLGSAAAGAAGAASGLIGGPELAAIATVLNVIAPILDKIASLFPDIVAGLKTFSDISKAGQRVSALAEEAALHGQGLSRDYLRARLEAESEAEHRRTRAKAEVDELVTETQFRRALAWR